MLETSNHLAGQSMIIALYAICKLCFYFLTTEFPGEGALEVESLVLRRPYFLGLLPRFLKANPSHDNCHQNEDPKKNSSNEAATH